MIKRITYKLVFLLIFSIMNLSAFAQFEEGKETVYSVPIVGAGIIAGTNNTVTYTNNGEASKKITNIVTFKINEQPTFLKSNFTAVVYLKIELWAVSNPLSSTIQTLYRSLKVNFDTATGAKYDVRSYILLDTAEQVKITVDTINITGYTGWDPKPTLQLENEMRVLRYYNLSNNTTFLNPSFDAPINYQDALGVSWTWNSATNNNMTQLEWAWVTDEMAGYYTGTDQLFQNNSSRVDLDTQRSYKIPLLYGDTGKLYYRARAALRKNDGSVITGPWSLPQKFPATGSIAGHQTNLNWQSSTSFAENGKFKTVIQYFDGTLRSRQTVTKDNSTGNTVVSETIYDLQGRPNIQILPTPTIDNTIQYFKDFNRFIGQKQITPPGQQLQYENPAKYFDLSIEASKCNGAPRLDSLTGNGKYYSTQNSWLSSDGKSRFIPNAEGYAYSEARYMDDATQRVSKQGGVGSAFQIGSGHETKYFYGKPAQQELDALFGTEVGDASHYSKNMVQDANGQMSISYVDMHGRTIATALAGDSTFNLQAIYTNTNYYPSNLGVTLTNQLLTPATNIINGNAIESVSTILAPANTLYNFTYKLDPATLSLLNCNSQQICFDCKYDLEISIRPEDCNNIPPIIKKYNNLQVTPCGSSMGFIGEGITVPTKQIDFSQSLGAGSWIVRKTLTINDSLFAIRKDSAQKAFLCRTEQNIYDSVYNVLAATSGCAAPAFNTTLPCDSCNANLGTFTSYRSKYLQSIRVANNITVYDADIHTQYSLDSLACADACNIISPKLSSLTSLRNQLLNDMVPYTGQYAIPKDSIKNAATGLFDPTRIEAKYNIFTNTYTTASGVITPKPYYCLYPKNESGAPSDYFTEDNHIDFSIEPNGTPNDRTILDAGITADFFTNLFQRSWARSLIFYHPEFSKLKFAETNLVSSYAFLDSVQACTTYATALAKGYLTPVTSDPYFVNNYNSTDKNNMQRYLTLDIGDSGENKPSIWQIANANVLCATKSDIEKEGCLAGAKKDGIDLSLNKDTVWEQFKNIYLSYRNDMVVAYINSQSGVLPQVEMDSLISQKKQLVFATSKDAANQNGLTWWPLATASNVDTAALATAALTSLNKITKTDMCEGQKPFWKARLLQCEQLQNWLNKNTPADSATVNTIISAILDSMVMVCHNSATPLQPYGNSTVNPSYSGVPRGFEEIINHVFKQHGIASIADSNYFCNPYTIDFPKPFGKNPPLLVNNTNIIDTCGCKQFAALKLEAKSLGFDTLSLTGATGMNQFFLTNYKDSLPAVIWQGLQKCNGSFFKDTCYNVISGPGYPYSQGAQMMAQSNSIECVDCGGPPVCPVPYISSVYYINTTSSVNNIQVNYSTNYIYTDCYVNIYDSLGRFINSIYSGCGSGSSVILSLPKCTKYKFTVTASNTDCNEISSMVTLSSPCASCPPAAAIWSVAYLNTGSTNNVKLDYTSSAATTNCKVVATNYATGVKYTQAISCGPSSVTLSLPGCQAYLIQIYSGVPGNCYDSSDIYYLPGCTWTCKHIYTPISLQSYVVMPSFLSCGYQKPCISCNTLNALVAEFKTIYPTYAVPYTDSINITVPQQKQNSLLARFLNYRTGFSKNANEYIAAFKNCTGGGDNDALCSFTKPLNDISDVYSKDTVPCRAAQTQAAFIAQLLFQQRKDSLIANFDSLYRSKCLGAKYTEQFYATYQPKEYHYTLYYYDQAGNLVKTLAPLAVKPNYDATYLAQVSAARVAATDKPNTSNNELLATQYRYNGLNQVVAQKSPDAGISKFWYDRLGRLAVSQNAKQKTVNNYSYTLYDILGRITEVGQKPQTTAMTQLISQDTTVLKGWMNGGGIKEEITATIYDEAYTPLDTILEGKSALLQKNLRNRVSYTYIKALDGNNWDAATFYTYDIHGNVDTLLQDYKTGMGAINCINTPGNPSGNRFKKMVYSYDLISGKVNAVAYQPGWADQFYHKYEYDAENRLTLVKTSKDRIYWEREAVYDYYRHGPLARTVLGENQVQGIDYAYTLQGWLKGVNTLTALPNSNACPEGTAFETLTINDRSQNGNPAVYKAKTSITFEPGFESNTNDSFEAVIDPNATPCNVADETLAVKDMGNDGQPGSVVAKDAYGFTLHYFDTAMVHDYIPIGASQPLASVMPTGFNFTSLYNGNIGGMSVNVPQAGIPLLYNYHYDQLNRLKSMNAYQGLNPQTNSWEPVSVSDYQENITYDPNGNIMTYRRNGDSRSTGMDKLAYKYVANTNKLNYVMDTITAATPADYTDIKNQSINNYDYDETGNLTKDISEGIGTNGITWTVYGKIKSITKTGTSISYTYDAGGNRISKTVNGKATYYVRDASGNIMSIYEKNDTLKQKEINLYGSSRLGVYYVDVDVQTCGSTLPEITTFTRGNKFFELIDYKGNVMAVVNDKKVQHSTDGITVNYYNAEVVTAQDYYPSGMLMPGRKYSIANMYRYGYQGYEKDNEISGEGNHLSFNDFGYDPRTGRRWTVDKHFGKYPSISPYASFNDNPIIFSDPEGKDAIVTIKGNVITVTTKIVLWGADATKDAVTKFQAEINGTWNGSNLTYKDTKSGTEYTVKFDIQVELAGGKEKVSSQPWGAYNPFNTNNYVEVNNTKLDAENAANGTAALTSGGDEGLFGTSNPAYIKGVPHEIGHMLGLDHHYTAGVGDEAGWENNVMGSLDGKDGKTGTGNVDQRNVNAVVAPAVNAFNKEKARVEKNNKLNSTRTVGGGPHLIPTEYKTKIDNSSMDQ